MATVKEGLVVKIYDDTQLTLNLDNREFRLKYETRSYDKNYTFAIPGGISNDEIYAFYDRLKKVKVDKYRDICDAYKINKTIFENRKGSKYIKFYEVFGFKINESFVIYMFVSSEMLVSFCISELTSIDDYIMSSDFRQNLYVCTFLQDGEADAEEIAQMFEIDRN